MVCEFCGTPNVLYVSEVKFFGEVENFYWCEEHAPFNAQPIPTSLNPNLMIIWALIALIVIILSWGIMPGPNWDYGWLIQFVLSLEKG